MDDAAKIKKINKTANDIMNISRNTLIANLRFLDIALCQFKFVPSEIDTFATEGQHVYFNPVWIIKRYMDEKDIFMRDYLHMVFHCIFKHMFVGKDVNQKYWNLACDMAVEFSISGLNIDCVKAKREAEQQLVFSELKTHLKLLTAEKIYNYYLNNPLTKEEYAKLNALFHVDNHSLWYDQIQDEEEEEKPETSSNNEENEKSNAVENPDTEVEDYTDPLEEQTEEENDKPQSSSNPFQSQMDLKDDDVKKSYALEDAKSKIEASNEENRNKKSKGMDSDDLKEGKNQYEGENSGNSNPNASGNNNVKQPIDKEKLAEKWKDIAKRVEVDLETFSKSVGDEAEAFSQNVKAVNREKYDYTTFLKKFARLGETLKLNEDEFDYIYYTYGLKIFKKVPLIEPLEYKDVNKIKEFVIAIDTSGSVSGEVAQTFVKKTYNILKSTENFFTRINLHIIQCDAQIQEDVKITNQVEFDHYIENMKLLGLGGTDFRPVFTYVDQLIKDKEFTHLKGLIYFTDGWGEFPKKKPNYDVAFVYIEDDYTNPDVPPWAMKIILQNDEIMKKE